VYFLVAGGCSLVGVIHSPFADALIAWPWTVIAKLHELHMLETARYQTPYHWGTAYALMAGLLVLFDAVRTAGPEPGLAPEHEGEESSPVPPTRSTAP
jgi:hypothetical protein